MAKFSINNDALSITLEQSENNFLIVNSLKNRYFLKEKNGIFTHKKIKNKQQ